ncbi:hypothetical protein VE03_00953 [Pseudogymnoascus sp. 23342-1-I1]|nr:hypothetical protein VE03_00953 [Pseudogymnoascus sp. 23342-1-I1]
MSNMATVSRPPSVHAPWRKSFIIPLFVINLLGTLSICVYGLTLYGVAVYLGTDTSITEFTRKTCLAIGILGLPSVAIVITHIILFSLFRLTARIFLYGNATVVILSFIQFFIGVAALAKDKTDEKSLADNNYMKDGSYMEILTLALVAANCFVALWMVVYAVIVWRRVNAGRGRDMSRARKGEGAAGAKGLDAQEEGGIPMV